MSPVASTCSENCGAISPRERVDRGRSARLVEWLDPVDDVNFRHFRMRHMIAELIRTGRSDGIPRGAMAPEFDLETTEGDRLRLSDLREKPVLLHFGSYT